MRYRLLRRFSVSAPRMTVRSHLPLSLKICAGLVAFGAAIAIGVVLGRIGTAPARGALDASLGRALEENRALRDQRDQLVAQGAVDTRRVMENATIKELGDQVTRLEADNARLKEDVAFFEAATAGRTPASAVDAASGIALRRFQVTADKSAQRVRYRLLLTQDSRANRDFVGSLALVATIQRGGQTTKLSLSDAAPDAAADAASYAVVFRSYKRIDGSFGLPADATLLSVEARVLEQGTVRVRQTAVPGDTPPG
jgi:hypothetical protein